MTFMIILLGFALIVGFAMVVVPPMLFGATAQRELEGAVPSQVSGLPPTLAVATRRGKRKAVAAATVQKKRMGLRWLTHDELFPPGGDTISSYDYSYSNTLRDD